MSCDNLQNQKFCARNCNYSSVCLRVSKSNNHAFQFFWTKPDEEGNLAEIFDLKNILIQNKKVNFFAKGLCMYPCIRPADKLHIELKQAEQIQIGEVAVYRRNNHFFAHRTIDKGNDNSLPYIITRPDNAKYNNDGPSFDENILGVVLATERNGKIFSVEKRSRSALKEFYLKIFFALLEIKWILMQKFLYILAFLQQFSTFRKIWQLFFKNSQKLRFTIHAPLNNNINSLFNTSISSEDLINLNHQEDEDKIFKWTLVAETGFATEISLSFAMRPKSCLYPGWWLSKAKVGPRYWGSRVEETILQKASELLGVLGASAVFVSIFKNDYFSWMFFKRAGFKESSSYKNLLKNRTMLEKAI